MIQVTRKDDRESSMSLTRRFNRKVAASSTLSRNKESLRFKKKQSKVDRRKKAIIRVARKEEKLAKMRLGIR